MAIVTAGGFMDRGSKRDLAAAGSILTMFLGAFILPVSPVGLLLIFSGALVMLLLMLNALRKEP